MAWRVQLKARPSLCQKGDSGLELPSRHRETPLTPSIYQRDVVEKVDVGMISAMCLFGH